MERMSRKTISDAFYQHEIEEELRDRYLSWSFHGNEDESIKTVLQKVNALRSTEMYPHFEDDCSEACATRGTSVPLTIYGCCSIFFKKGRGGGGGGNDLLTFSAQLYVNV